MDEINVTDERLKNNPAYQEFEKENPGYGYLKIRASAANSAVPISGINVKVSKVIGNNKIIFFEGETDASGMINDIRLPAPASITSDEEVPNFTEYKIEATGSNQNINEEYIVSVCCGFTIIQYINVTPMFTESMRDIDGN